MAKARILVADDEPDVVRALTLRLKAAGYEVVTANDGLEATRVAVQELPDLILLDIGMPCGDGHTVARRLREKPKTADIPVIFVTARVSSEDLQDATEEGAAGYLLKPFQSDELLELVEQALAAKA